MSRKKISFGLGESEIDRAIREVEAFKRDFLKKVETYRKRIADEIAGSASTNFRSALLDDVVGGAARRPDVSVKVEERGKITVIVAVGEDAVWCEFGAGVYHNGSAGASPNPYGAGLGLTIGSYGKGRGKQTAWGYYDEGGELIITHGTPASMPMYHAVQEVTRRAVDIAREVFS